MNEYLRSAGIFNVSFLAVNDAVDEFGMYGSWASWERDNVLVESETRSSVYIFESAKTNVYISVRMRQASKAQNRNARWSVIADRKDVLASWVVKTVFLSIMME